MATLARSTAPPRRIVVPGGIVVIDKFLVSLKFKLSVTCTVKLLTAASGEIPEMIPVDPASERPVGSAPAVIDQVKGAVPPVNVRV